MSELKKRLDKLESVINIEKADWNFYLENPNELTPKQTEFFKKDEPELFEQLVKNVIIEMKKRL